ncbi:MAG: YebC/PmpR family DNA-binding transcriptional regulator [Endomicrobium sp.]|jgi:YebC/PmpR family DNA-binding regulatory protein|nr:YebC/PmpR family DNA-binding transcriptional regulator [Endomicrobium sp.]
MSGHNKWSSIKHKKAVTDARKGKIFTKIIREIIIATRNGGEKIENNPRLKNAIEDAREANMPSDNIKKAIQRGSGKFLDSIYDEIIYEGYGPAGVALIVEVTTNNKNRSASEIKKIFAKHSGSIVEVGCVSWMFSKKGCIIIDKSLVKNEEFMINTIIESGAEDFKNKKNDNIYEIITSTSIFENVKNKLKEKKIQISSSKIVMIPQTYVTISGNDAINMLNLIYELEGHIDVKNIYSNSNISNNDI